MRAQLMVAAIALMSAGGLGAEPLQIPARDASQPLEDRAVEVVLASADEDPISTSAVEQRDAAPPKPHRAARVTTCRCGDPRNN